MPRRRRMTKVKLDTKSIIDVTSASLLVSNLPKFIDMVLPLDPLMQKAAAVGATWFVGVFAKRPGISNAGLAVGLTDMIEPFIDDLLGGIQPELVKMPPGALMPPSGVKPIPEIEPAGAMGDYLTLNDYTNNPNQGMTNFAYRDSY